jgi:hypothetical protein
VRLAVDAQGRALVTYVAAGKQRHVLVLPDALNALQPTQGARQVQLTVDYGGGWGLYHKPLWKHFVGLCRPYDGPPLAWYVAGCKAPDGSYWTLQAFPQPLPDLGYTPWSEAQKAVWLEISHWSPPLPTLEVWQGWNYDGRWNTIFGRYTYDGTPVYGFGTTHYGAPTDAFGRLLYLDTYDAPLYGPGWRRQDSFVPHNPTGVFCYGFYTHDPTRGGYIHPPGQDSLRGPGVGIRYRLTAQGPGVLPDVAWEGAALPAFNKSNPQDIALAREMAGLLRQLAPDDSDCLAGLSSFLR